jgi:hypothetical protein
LGLKLEVQSLPLLPFGSLKDLWCPFGIEALRFTTAALLFSHGKQDWLQKLSLRKSVEQRDATASCSVWNACIMTAARLKMAMIDATSSMSQKWGSCEELSDSGEDSRECSGEKDVHGRERSGGTSVGRIPGKFPRSIPGKKMCMGGN